MATAKLTPHQKDTLLALARRSMLGEAERPGRFIHSKDCGGPAALEHLTEKGYAERSYRPGPRGGEHYYYRPTALGYGVVTREAAKYLAVEREMSAGEIDTVICNARRTGSVVRIFVGPDRMEFRAVPGEVARDPRTGLLLMKFGQRSVALAAIVKVVA